MHTYPCIMTEPLQPREVRDVEELRALAHPMRQRILRRLHEAGPATSTTLARDLGENSGIMSYHLRLLAAHDFVREVPGRGRGRERWWEASPQPAWIPREAVSEPPACTATTSICTRDLHARQMPMPAALATTKALPRNSVPTQNARHTGGPRQDEVSISLLLSSAMGGETSIRPRKLVPGVKALLSDAGCRARRRTDRRTRRICCRLRDQFGSALISGACLHG